MSQVVNVIRTVDAFHSLSVPVQPTRFERWVKRLTFPTLIISAIGWSAMGYFLIAAHFYDFSSELVELLVDGCYFVILLGLLVIIFNAAALVVSCLNSIFNGNETRFFALEYSAQQAGELIDYDLPTLRSAVKAIDIEMELLQGRVALFLGGKDKVAILALAVMGWAFFNQYPLDSATWDNKLFYFGTAAIVGFLIGGFIVNRDLRRLQYQKGVLELAICHRDAEEVLQRCFDQPTLKGGWLRWHYWYFVSKVRSTLTYPYHLLKR